VRQARSVLQNLYFCRRKFEIATMQRGPTTLLCQTMQSHSASTGVVDSSFGGCCTGTSSTEQRGMSATTNEWAHLNWIEAVQPRHCAVTGQPEVMEAIAEASCVSS
jgi:hypothetical protein